MRRSAGLQPCPEPFGCAQGKLRRYSAGVEGYSRGVNERFDSTKLLRRSRQYPSTAHEYVLRSGQGGKTTMTEAPQASTGFETDRPTIDVSHLPDHAFDWRATVWWGNTLL